MARSRWFWASSYRDCFRATSARATSHHAAATASPATSASDLENLTEIEQRGSPLDVVHDVRETLEVSDGRGVRVRRLRCVTGAPLELPLLGEVLRVPVVVRQEVEPNVDGIGVALEERTGRLVDGGSDAEGDAVVGDLLCHGVAEDPRLLAILGHEVCVEEGRQAGGHIVDRPEVREDRGEAVRLELAADDACDLERPPRSRVEGIDTAQHQRMEALGEIDAGGRSGRRDVDVLAAQVVHELLDVEGVALPAFHDELHDVGGRLDRRPELLLQLVDDHPFDLRRVELAELQSLVRGERLEAPQGIGVDLGAERDDEQQRQAPGLASEHLEEVDGRLVDPVGVFEDDHERTLRQARPQDL
jgi:hypothetical protein